MDSKELVTDYNQCFLTLLKWIPRASKPVEDVTIEFYTSGLPMSMAMYVKNLEKGTLEEAFQEALKFEKNMTSLKGISSLEPSKYKGKGKVSTSKPSEDKKPYDSMDMESLQRIIKKLSNDLVDLKKGGGEGSSSQKKLFRFPSKKDKNMPPTNKTTPSQTEGINMEDIVQALQTWETENMTEVDDEGEEIRNNKNNLRNLTSL
jgi:hypothetical protein